MLNILENGGGQLRSKQTLYLDVDGVLANWTKDVLRLFNRTETEEECNRWNFFDGWCSSVEEFWSVLDNTPGFWESLELYPWSIDLYEALCQNYHVYICSSPSRDPNCWSGKITWLKEKMGIKSSKVVLTNHKYLLAKSNTLLLDDSTSNLLNFQTYGGKGILFEQPWNINDPKTHEINYIYDLKSHTIVKNPGM